MTLTEINELRKINKKLNQRMVRMEKTRGTALDLTKTRQYRELQKLAREQGVKSRSKTAGARFKERGLEKLSEEKFKELKKGSLRGEAFMTPKRALNEQQKRFAKAGIKMSAKELNDFNEIYKSDTWRRLEEFYVSDEIVEIYKENGWSDRTIGDKLDQFLSLVAGKVLDVDELREFLGGWISLAELQDKYS